MKVRTNNVSVESYGVHHSGEFKIKASAKAFNILSSQIYTDKPLAISRELICNMYDAHVARDMLYDSGQATEYMAPKGTPFRVIPPNAFESTIVFRDFGIGLSDENVETIYTTYFESTKSESDDYIGALGLGSKSPFCYVENFTVASFYNGVKTVYLMFIGEEGVPKPAIISKESVDHTQAENKNGLEITIAVSQRDYYDFKRSLTSVLTYFHPDTYTVPEMSVEYFLEQVTPTAVDYVYHASSLTHDRLSILQGNVRYPVKIAQLKFKSHQQHVEQYFKTTNHLFVVPIGTADVSASREELSYDRHTIRNLKIILLQFYRKVRSEARKALPPRTMPYWERLRTYIEISKMGIIYKRVVNKAICARYGETGEITIECDRPVSGYDFITDVIPAYRDLRDDLRDGKSGSIYLEAVHTKYENNRYYGKTIFYRKKSNTRSGGTRYEDYLRKSVVILVDDGKVCMVDIYNLMNRFYNTECNEIFMVRSIDKKQSVDELINRVNEYLASIENPPVEVITYSQLSDKYEGNYKELRRGYSETETTTRRSYVYLYDSGNRHSESFSDRTQVSDLTTYLRNTLTVSYVLLSDGYPECGLTKFSEKYRVFEALGLSRQYLVVGVSKSNMSALRKVYGNNMVEFDDLLKSRISRLSSDDLSASYSACIFDRNTTVAQFVDHATGRYSQVNNETIRKLIRYRTKIGKSVSPLEPSVVSSIERVSIQYGVDGLKANRDIDEEFKKLSREFPLIKFLPTTGISKDDLSEMMLYIETKAKTQETQSE